MIKNVFLYRPPTNFHSSSDISWAEELQNHWIRFSLNSPIDLNAYNNTYIRMWRENEFISCRLCTCAEFIFSLSLFSSLFCFFKKLYNPVSYIHFGNKKKLFLLLDPTLACQLCVNVYQGARCVFFYL